MFCTATYFSSTLYQPTSYAEACAVSTGMAPLPAPRSPSPPIACACLTASAGLPSGGLGLTLPGRDCCAEGGCECECCLLRPPALAVGKGSGLPRSGPLE
jgi:hypothetical protein